MSVTKVQLLEGIRSYIDSNAETMFCILTNASPEYREGCFTWLVNYFKIEDDPEMVEILGTFLMPDYLLYAIRKNKRSINAQPQQTAQILKDMEYLESCLKITTD